MWHVNCPNWRLHYDIRLYHWESMVCSYIECLTCKQKKCVWIDDVAGYWSARGPCANPASVGGVDGQLQTSKTRSAADLQRPQWSGTLTARHAVDRCPTRRYALQNVTPKHPEHAWILWVWMIDMYSVHVQGKALMRPTTSMNMAGPRIGKSTQESKLPCFLHFICCIMYDVHVGSENLMDIALMVGAICARKWVCWNKAQLGLWKCSCGRRHALRPLLDVWLL